MISHCLWILSTFSHLVWKSLTLTFIFTDLILVSESFPLFLCFQHSEIVSISNFSFKIILLGPEWWHKREGVCLEWAILVQITVWSPDIPYNSQAGATSEHMAGSGLWASPDVIHIHKKAFYRKMKIIKIKSYFCSLFTLLYPMKPSLFPSSPLSFGLICQKM